MVRKRNVIYRWTTSWMRLDVKVTLRQQKNHVLKTSVEFNQSHACYRNCSPVGGNVEIPFERSVDRIDRFAEGCTLDTCGIHRGLHWQRATFEH